MYRDGLSLINVLHSDYLEVKDLLWDHLGFGQNMGIIAEYWISRENKDDLTNGSSYGELLLTLPSHGVYGWFFMCFCRLQSHIRTIEVSMQVLCDGVVFTLSRHPDKDKEFLDSSHCVAAGLQILQLQELQM